MLTTLADKTITVLHPDLIEDHGTQVADWSSPTETVVPGCDVQPFSSDEMLTNRDAVIVQLAVWAPPGTAVEATDRVRYNGVDYDIHGEPDRWQSASGSLDHVEILLKHVGG